MQPRVLFATSELAPLVKTGGLADVSKALPEALARLGLDVRIIVPGYPGVVDGLKLRCVRSRIEVLPEVGRVRLLSGRLPGAGIRVYVVDSPGLYARPGGPYVEAGGSDWPDNHLRFGLLSRMAALLGSDASPVRWRADLVHLNDWQSGLAAAYLRFHRGATARSVMSIHNLAFAGRYSPAVMKSLELPPESFDMHGLEFNGDVSFLKAGLYYSDQITTVSPTYAREIQSAPLGGGFEGLLAGRADRLTGILNGIDLNSWSPAEDAYLAHRYDVDSLGERARNKRALQVECGFEPSPRVPLVGLVSRLSDQKGADLSVAAVETLAERLQFVALGSGEPALETSLRALEQRLPGRVRVRLGLDEAMAHRIEAGADLFLMPSRYEPCGLNQMYSMRYGAVPVVRRTGGLADSVVEVTAETIANGTATGFMFDQPSAEALSRCLSRALDMYEDEEALWGAIQRAGMTRDFSWDRSARQYVEIYRRTAGS